MKKCAIILVVLVLFCASGCKYSAYKEYFNEVNDYQDIWELTGFRHGYDDKSPLFPKSIDSLNVASFSCRYDEQLPLGEGIQIFLEIVYDDVSFIEETDRIAKNTSENIENFEQCGLSARYIRLGQDGCWEYALIDDANKKVYYIFVYNLPREAIEFEDKFLPDNYVDYE